MPEYPKSFRQADYEAVWARLKVHHACLVIGMPGVGKSTFLRQLQRFLADELHVVVPVDLNELFALEDHQAVFGLMERRLSEVAGTEPTADLGPYESLRQTLKTATAGKKTVYLLLDRFEKAIERLPLTFQDALTSLIAQFDGHVQVVLFANNTLDNPPEQVADQLQSLLAPSIHYLLPYSMADAEMVIDSYTEEKLSVEQRGWIVTLSGGHSRLIRALLGHVELLGAPAHTIAELPEVRLQCERIFGIIRPEELPAERRQSARLKRLGILAKQQGEWVVFSPLSEDFLENAASSRGFMWLDEQTGALFIEGQQRDDEFSAKEYQLLKYFLQHTKEVVSRDALAEAVWGEEVDVSNEAIDQLVSRVRGKIGDSERKHVQTVFGRGYKLVI